MRTVARFFALLIRGVASGFFASLGVGFRRSKSNPPLAKSALASPLIRGAKNRATVLMR